MGRSKPPTGTCEAIGSSFVAGRVRGGERDGQTWIGVEDNDQSYQRLVGALSGTVTHSLVIGDDAAVRRLISLLEDHVADV